MTEPKNPPKWVDTSEAIKSLVETLSSLDPTKGEAIYMDLEGIDLCRTGTISILQIYLPSNEQVYLVDVHVLGESAFSTATSEGKTFKSVLEAEEPKKYLFDCRNDSDALNGLYNVKLAGVVDVQLLELASRYSDRAYLDGLAKCIRVLNLLPYEEFVKWDQTKTRVANMLYPNRGRGGIQTRINKRPLPQILVDYCVGDVVLLPKVAEKYLGRLGSWWLGKAKVETAKRLEESWSKDYKPNGPYKTLGPDHWRIPIMDHWLEDDFWRPDYEPPNESTTNDSTTNDSTTDDSTTNETAINHSDDDELASMTNLTL